ncbi:MAG: IclR family transcriptional regulator [Deltaproteobacteria bacterium]|nr:IclR family transcriptional regulator [Deltaproteobacteria bacterium]
MAIQSVQRAIDILSLFSLSRPSLGISELSRLMGLPRATVHGLVRTLLENRLLQQDLDTRKYRLGFKVFELGAIVGNTLDLNRKAAAPLYTLARRTRLDARLAIWEGGTVLITMGAGFRSQAFFAEIGPRMPAYCSASGRIFLAHLPANEQKDYIARTQFRGYTPFTMTDPTQLLRELAEARARGYAVNREELGLGVIAFAAPVLDRTGRVVAAVSLSTGPDPLPKDREKRVIDALVKGAMIISRELGYFPENIGTGSPHQPGES